MTSPDHRERFLRALGGELRRWPLTRRRMLRELAQHLDDSVAELQAAGLSEGAAIDEALRRLGDVGVIAAAFRDVRAGRRRWPRGRSLRSPAWIAAGALALVTGWAAELPPASGAKTTANPSVGVHLRPSGHHGQLARPRRPAASRPGPRGRG
jgi:DNA-binding transcriptional ArsR family regulator